MLRWLKSRWALFYEARRRSRELGPRRFQDLAREMAQLIDLAGQVGPQEDDFQTRLRQLRDEMDELVRLADMPEFWRLPTEKRQELHESLLSSRARLLETVKSIPAATETVQ